MSFLLIHNALLAQDDTGHAPRWAILIGALAFPCLVAIAIISEKLRRAKENGKTVEAVLSENNRADDRSKSGGAIDKNTGLTRTIMCSGCSQLLRYTPRLEPFTIRCPRCKTEMVAGMSVKPPVLPIGISDNIAGSLSPEAPQVVLSSAVEAAGEALKIANLAASVEFNKATSRAVLKEIVCYYIKVAISAVMIRREWYGKDGFNQARTEVFDAVCRNLTRRLYKLEDFIGEKSQLVAEAYFVKDIDGLGIAEEQVYAFAAKCHQQVILSEMPDNQLDIFYYTMRVAKLLEVSPEIDGVIGSSVSKILVTQLGVFSDKIQTVVSPL